MIKIRKNDKLQEKTGKKKSHFKNIHKLVDYDFKRKPNYELHNSNNLNIFLKFY
jgi:hypothetical protein